MREVTGRQKISNAEAKYTWRFYVIICLKHMDHVLVCSKNRAHMSLHLKMWLIVETAIIDTEDNTGFDNTIYCSFH